MGHSNLGFSLTGVLHFGFLRSFSRTRIMRLKEVALQESEGEREESDDEDEDWDLQFAISGACYRH